MSVLSYVGGSGENRQPPNDPISHKTNLNCGIERIFTFFLGLTTVL